MYMNSWYFRVAAAPGYAMVVAFFVIDDGSGRSRDSIGHVVIGQNPASGEVVPAARRRRIGGLFLLPSCYQPWRIMAAANSGIEVAK
jgi:hypothetical protein